jgi:hypothetical protein
MNEEILTDISLESDKSGPLSETMDRDTNGNQDTKDTKKNVNLCILCIAWCNSCCVIWSL